MNTETKRVIEIMRRDYPECADYNVTNEVVEILDSADRVIATITADQLTRYWNKMEGE